MLTTLSNLITKFTKIDSYHPDLVLIEFDHLKGRLELLHEKFEDILEFSAALLSKKFVIVEFEWRLRIVTIGQEVLNFSDHFVLDLLKIYQFEFYVIKINENLVSNISLLILIEDSGHSQRLSPRHSRKITLPGTKRWGSREAGTGIRQTDATNFIASEAWPEVSVIYLIYDYGLHTVDADFDVLTLQRLMVDCSFQPLVCTS